MQKKSKVFIGLGIALVAAIAFVCVYMQTAGKEGKVQKDLELASQYLDGLDYEQAIAVYEQVLSIDPKNQEALVGSAKAYTGLARQQEDTEQAVQSIEQAVAYVEQVYGLYPEEVVVQEVVVTAYIQAGDLCANAERYEESVAYYEKAMALELDESLEEKREDAVQKIEEAKELLEEQKRQEEAAEKAKEYEVLLKPVLEAWQNGDMEEVKRLIRQDKYNQMAEMLGEGESYYCGDYDENGERSGVGIGVYRVHDYYDIPFYYIGEWKNNVREGQADWIYSIEEGDGGVYHCGWINDFPEGDVTCEWDYDLLEEGGAFTNMKGNVTHGLYNRKTFTTMEPDGNTHTWTVTYDNGYINVLYTRKDYDGYDIYIVADKPDEDTSGRSGSYSYSEEEIHLTEGIPGFAEFYLW